MVRKFLIVGKRVYLSAGKIDGENRSIYNIDLEIPLTEYWELQVLLKKADFLQASKEQMADVQAIHRRIFRLVAPYTIYEVDRLWLLRRTST